MDVRSKSSQDLYEGLPRLIGPPSCGPVRSEKVSVRQRNWLAMQARCEEYGA